LRVAIVGSRTYPSEPTVRAYVRSLPAGTVVVSGGARGVDSWAEDEARRCGLAVEVHKPDYQAYSPKIAPLVRNRIIAERCDELIGFSFEGSPGTAYTAKYARRIGRLVTVWEWPAVPAVLGCPPDCLTCLDTHGRSGTGELSPPEPSAPNGGR
jgi:predicted Rossmann fold nucleotide-binding protein DprA/Smf involved in DNA uptake